MPALRSSPLRPALAAAFVLAAHAGTALAGDGGIPASAVVIETPASLMVQGATTPLDLPPKLYTFKLDDTAPDLSLLRSYFDASIERPGPYTRYVGGPYGRWSRQPWIALSWRAPEAGPPPPDPSADADALASSTAYPALSDTAENERGPQIVLDLGGDPSSPSFGFDPPSRDLHVRMPSESWITRLIVAGNEPPFWTTGPSLSSNGFDAIWKPPGKPVVDWRCRRRPVTFVRFQGQSDRFNLVRCNGSIEPGAIDRLSIVARPPDVPDPGELPDEPDADSWENGEWLPRVKLIHPRLVWVLQKIADAFPYRAMYVYSGYRPHRDKANGGHHSMHGEGRAMDIQVHGVRNESLFAFCRKLDDVGCGYYPNSKFVHVDIRKPGTGHAFWIDISGPGEPSQYVDSWPGVIEHGALAWATVPPKNGGSVPARTRTPDDRGTHDVIRK
ncbi:MAG: D-Ala-D-Ala carboxypeptidase family metallohydrolase [Polyangiaceae bacterium]